MYYLRVSSYLLAAAVVACLFTSPLQAAVIVDDSWADGDLAKTGALDSNWWTSSSSSGIEVAVGSMGLVTGSSGRGVHTVFPTQTLANVGDSLKATYTFTTPATVGTGSSSLRVGLFDTLGRAGLDATVSASSGSPNPVYGWSIGNGGPGDQGLPGYMLDMDVNDGGNDDLNFREHVISSATGRLMQTTGNGSFSSFSSGPDGEYLIVANTTYTGSFTITRINATDFELAATLAGASHSVTDTFDSDSFGMLAFHANGGQFGSSNVAGDPDNGIDFSNVKIEFIPIPEPSAAVLLLGALASLPGVRRRK